MIDKNSSNEHNESSKAKNPFRSKVFISQKHIIAVYTFLRVLVEMKRKLGLEAMLIYMEKVLSIIDDANKNFRDDVTYAIRLIDVERIYNDAVE